MTTIVQKRVFASLPRAERGKQMKISGDPQGKNFLYCNGNSVFIRNMEDPSIVDIYTQHSKPTTVARYSPSRFYIASGDMAGKVRIWDTVNPEHILKNEFPILGGPLLDLSWDHESKKIALCGQGREKFARVINMDTGTSVGEVSGHSKSINTISYRPRRPFRLVTASEDFSVGFFEGPPFKFSKTANKHTNFCNVARYSPDGSVIISGGSDGKLYKYDGDKLDDDKTMEISSPTGAAHKGGIYEICYSPDSREVLTAGGDKTAKIFSVDSGEEICVFDMGRGKENKWQNMQVGCLWQNNEIITVNAVGHITYHDRSNPEMPKRVIKGHMKPITCLAVSADRSTVFTGGLEGIIYWDIESGDNDSVSDKIENVTDMVIDGNNLLSVGVDDILRVTSVSDKVLGDAEVKLDSQPKQIDSRNGIAAVACVEHVIVFESGQGSGDTSLKKASMMPMKSEPTCISIHPNGSCVAVGFMAKEVMIYSLQNGQLSEQKKIETKGEVSCVAYSPDGAHLAYGALRKVVILPTVNYESIVMESEKHTARVICMAWSPDSQWLASGSLDNTLKLWKADGRYDERPSIKVCDMSYVNKLAWVDPVTIITGCQDSNVKQFTVCDNQ